MRAANIENIQPVLKGETRDELEQFVKAERVEAYLDDDGYRKWSKAFRRGGPLEWCNPPFDFDPAYVDVGTEDDWAENARQQYRHQIGAIPGIGVST